MKLKTINTILAAGFCAAATSQAGTFFTTTFSEDYSAYDLNGDGEIKLTNDIPPDDDFYGALLSAGWTTVVYDGGGNAGIVPGVDLWGFGSGTTGLALTKDYTGIIAEGDVFTIDATVRRDYTYGMEILIDGVVVAGSKNEAAPGNVLGQVSYTATAADVGKPLVFSYGHYDNWAETTSITFGVTPVPEPSSSALFGLGGLALLLRRKR